MDGKPVKAIRVRKGFTLIELLVVIAIIGILSSVLVMSFGFARIRARNSAAKGTISQAGRAVETFKSMTEDRVLIVQRPQFQLFGSLTTIGFCFAAVPKSRCVYGHGILPQLYYSGSVIPAASDTGFVSQLFNGAAYNSLTGYPVRIDAAASPKYWYMYMTRDCTWDVPPAGVHGYSKYPDYLILARLMSEGENGEAVYYWFKNGSPGLARSDYEVPLIPEWTEGPRFVAPDGTITTGCATSYP